MLGAPALVGVVPWRTTASDVEFAGRSTSWLVPVLGLSLLAAAVAAIIDMPAGSHTVASLAEVAGMSRTTFAERFAETYGRTPIDFLQAVRLRHAAHLLRTTDVPVKVIASAVGYRSRSQFSHAFRARYELDPSTFRRMSSAAREEDLQLPVAGRAMPEASD